MYLILTSTSFLFLHAYLAIVYNLLCIVFLVPAFLSRTSLFGIIYLIISMSVAVRLNVLISAVSLPVGEKLSLVLVHSSREN